MARKHYEAHLHDGTVLTRESDRDYSAAYAIYNHRKEIIGKGFSRSVDLAQKAAAAWVKAGADRHFEVVLLVVR